MYLFETRWAHIQFLPPSPLFPFIHFPFDCFSFLPQSNKYSSEAPSPADGRPGWTKERQIFADCLSNDSNNNIGEGTCQPVFRSPWNSLISKLYPIPITMFRVQR